MTRQALSHDLILTTRQMRSELVGMRENTSGEYVLQQLPLPKCFLAKIYHYNNGTMFVFAYCWL
jgi:hypothetical protein